MLDTLSVLTVTEPANDIRIKVTNRCSWDCKWCHREGSNLDQDLQLNSPLRGFLMSMKEELGITAIHLTGGEPTLHPGLPNQIEEYSKMGFEVSLTTNGSKPTIWPSLMEAGLRRANFSLHTLNATTFAQFHQNPRTEAWAKNALRNTCDSISIAQSLGIAVKVNTTIVDSSSEWRPIYEFCKRENIPFRAQNELSSPSALIAIEQMVQSVNGTLVKVIRKGATSRISHEYVDGDGYRFRVKLIAPASLVHLCSECKVKDHCTEGFYTIRLEPTTTKDAFQIRLCLHRSDAGAVLAPNEFLGSPVFTELKTKYQEQYCISYLN